MSKKIVVYSITKDFGNPYTQMVLGVDLFKIRYRKEDESCHVVSRYATHELEAFKLAHGYWENLGYEVTLGGV